jgi:hypothetical protein
MPAQLAQEMSTDPAADPAHSGRPIPLRHRWECHRGSVGRGANPSLRPGCVHRFRPHRECRRDRRHRSRGSGCTRNRTAVPAPRVCCSVSRCNPVQARKTERLGNGRCGLRPGDRRQGTRAGGRAVLDPGPLQWCRPLDGRRPCGLSGTCPSFPSRSDGRGRRCRRGGFPKLTDDAVVSWSVVDSAPLSRSRTSTRLFSSARWRPSGSPSLECRSPGGGGLQPRLRGDGIGAEGLVDGVVKKLPVRADAGRRSSGSRASRRSIGCPPILARRVHRR